MTDDDPSDPAAATLAETGDGGRRDSSTRLPGERIGKFVVIERLGAGAMGVVFAAFDPDLDRKVALKLVRSPERAGADANVRLLREARAMAKVSHPHVLAIHEVGTVGDEVFLATEYAAGGTLRAWCAAEPRTTKDIVARFVQAGRGLAAAHEAGLVHRDFKPENVLLTKDGIVRVADFGIVGRATRIDPTEVAASSSLDVSLTVTGTLIGTPAYMAPEQHRCEEVGPAADQFAFCVALWEALYGTRPFAGSTYGVLAVNVLEDNVEDPPGDRDVPRWLRDIVRRGLHTDPAARWPSMTALLAALEDDPIAARRRRLRVAGAALGLTAIAGVAAFALARRDSATTCDDIADQLAGVWDPQRAVQLRAAFADTKRWYATDTYERVAQQLDGYAHEWVSARTEACRIGEIHDDADVSPRITCLDGRLADLRALVKVLSTGPGTDVLDQAAQAVDRLLPVSGCSDPSTLAAITRPRDDRLRALAERVAEARALDIAGKYNEALAAAKPAVEEAERIGYEPALAAALSVRANIETMGLDFATAEATLRRTLDVAADAHDDALVAGTWSALILVVGRLEHRADEALQMRTAAEAALRRAGRKPEAESVLMLAIGQTLLEKGDFDQAYSLIEQALTLVQSVRGPDDLRSGLVLSSLGLAAIERHDMRRAEDQLRRALAILEKRLGPEHPVLREVNFGYGRALAARGNYGDALPQFEHALALTVKKFGDAYNDVPMIERKIGVALWMLHRSGAARPHLERAVSLREKALGADDAKTLFTLEDLAKVELDLGKRDDAQAHLARVCAGLEKARPGTLELGDCFDDLAEAELALGHANAARDLARRAIALGEANKVTPAAAATTRFLLARALAASGDHAGALPLARQARTAFDANTSRTLSGDPLRDPDRIPADISAFIAR